MCDFRNIILDCVWDLKSRVCHLFSEDFEGIFNRDYHDFDEMSIKSLLSKMYNGGYIEFFHGQEKVQLKEKIASTEVDSQWYVSLTKKGGELWESVFQPNWDLYIEVDSEILTDDDSVETITIRAGSLEVLCHLLKEFQAGLKYKEISSLEPLLTWNPTYWKSLTQGFTVTLFGGEEFLQNLAWYISRVNWRNQ